MNARVNKLLMALNQRGLQCMIVTREDNRRYLSGFTASSATLLIHPKECILITDFRYQEQASKQARDFKLEITSSARGEKSILSDAVERLEINQIGYESDYATVDWQQAYREVLAPCTLESCSGIIQRIREIKDTYEIDCIQKAAKVTDDAFSHALKIIRPGVTEIDIKAEVCYHMSRQGCEPSFEMICASGENSSMPHAVATHRKFQPGDFVTMDFGCKYDGYCSDMTRTVAIGFATEEMKRVYDTVREAQEMALSAIRARVSCHDIDAIARNHIRSAGYGAYFGHALGHGLGLFIHEEPRFSPTCYDILQSGVCISVEPGIYLPGKFGVRIEDIVCVTEDGCKNFTTSNKEMIIL